jgi:Uma2 family endonuclease
MTAIAAPLPFTPPRHFDNGAEWLHALGDVPMERIIFDPWPGTATEADLLRFVECDKRLCELIDGTLVEKPVGYRESAVAMRLGARLTLWAHANDAGVVTGADSTLRMRNGRIRLPDVAFVSRERFPGNQLPAEAIPSLTPDLAVEVLSESNTVAEMEQKLREYFQSGTRLAWLIDIRERTISVYHEPARPLRVLEAADLLDGEQVAPGFSMPVAELFRNLPEKPA